MGRDNHKEILIRHITNILGNNMTGKENTLTKYEVRIIQGLLRTLSIDGLADHLIEYISTWEDWEIEDTKECENETVEALRGFVREFFREPNPETETSSTVPELLNSYEIVDLITKELEDMSKRNSYYSKRERDVVEGILERVPIISLVSDIANYRDNLNLLVYNKDDIYVLIKSFLSNIIREREGRISFSYLNKGGNNYLVRIDKEELYLRNTIYSTLLKMLENMIVFPSRVTVNLTGTEFVECITHLIPKDGSLLGLADEITNIELENRKRSLASREDMDSIKIVLGYFKNR